MLSTDKVVHAEDTSCYRDYVCQVSKADVCNKFNTSLCTKDLKTHKAISCYSLQHQASNGKGKNSVRKRRDILVFDYDPQRFIFISPP